MNQEKHLFTSESVSVGHPDKVADQISDEVLDECLRQDKNSHVACETLCTTNRVVVAGEIATNAEIDVDGIVRGVVRDIGYEQDGFSWRTLEVQNYLHRQSPDIAMGVGSGEDQGAGDQGIMFGYACGTAETEYMPVPIYYAHRVMEHFAQARRCTEFGLRYLRPDAKCQLTFEYGGDEPVLRTVVVSHQHTEDMRVEDLRIICWNDLHMVIPMRYWQDDTRLLVNPTGRFVIGGPDGDTGLTGRKIIVDTYGGYGRHGGGAFSGKDPSKVDRSAAYMCRHVAKHLVKSGMCGKCEIQVGYAIGVAEPVSIYVDSFGTGDDGQLSKYVREKFDFRPGAIIERLGLTVPWGWSYNQAAMNGHFGHQNFPWERDAIL